MSADTATIQKWFDAHVDDDDKEIAIKRIARRFRSGTRQSEDVGCRRGAGAL